MNFFLDIANIIIQFVFGVLILFVLLRFLFQTAQVDSQNPLSHAIIRFTSPLLRPFRQIIPSFRKIDLAAIVLLILLQYTELLLLELLQGGLGFFSGADGLLKLILIAAFKLLMLTTWVYIVAIFIMVIFSWIQSGSYNPILGIAMQLTAPLIRPIRRLMPDMGMIDLSPAVALLVIFIIQMALNRLL